MLYISIFIGRWEGGGDFWVWRVEIGSKGGGSAKILVILGIGRMPKIFYVDWELGKNGM